MHWVDSTADAPPSRRWVTKSLDVMKDVWAEEVGRLGYRAPVTDGRRGGNKKFDVYLKDVGVRGLLRLLRARSAASPATGGWPRATASSTTTSPGRQFGARPMQEPAGHRRPRVLPRRPVRLRLRRGRLDDGGDRHLDRGAGRRRRQRQPPVPPLRPGQPARRRPLDTLRPAAASSQYGNWVFFEYLSQRYGTGIVRRIWENADGQAPQLLHPRGEAHPARAALTFAEVFRAYAAGEHDARHAATPRATRWPAAPMAARAHAERRRPQRRPARSGSTTCPRGTCWSGRRQAMRGKRLAAPAERRRTAVGQRRRRRTCSCTRRRAT